MKYEVYDTKTYFTVMEFDARSDDEACRERDYQLSLLPPEFAAPNRLWLREVSEVRDSEGRLKSRFTRPVR